MFKIILFCCVFFITFSQIFSQENTVVPDSLQVTLKEYKKLSVAGLSDQERIDQYKEWREILFSQIEECPASPAKRSALYEIMYICNALNEEDATFSVLDELLKSPDIHDEERLRLTNEYAEVAHTKFLRCKDKDSGLLALRYFDESNTLLSSLLSRLKKTGQVSEQEQ